MQRDTFIRMQVIPISFIMRHQLNSEPVAEKLHQMKMKVFKREWKSIGALNMSPNEMSLFNRWWQHIRKKSMRKAKGVRRVYADDLKGSLFNYLLNIEIINRTEIRTFVENIDISEWVVNDYN